jgi:hypothetical protein
MNTTQVVRVATSNNFNCTPKEWDQVNQFAKANPTKSFFINSNIHTPKLNTIANHPYKAVVTANPNLKITQSEIARVIARLAKIKNQVSFVRVKYIPHNEMIMALLGLLLKCGFNVVITLQRFNSKHTLLQYTNTKYYKYSCSRYRLAGHELKEITRQVNHLANVLQLPVWICDRKGLGCQTCKLCSTLTTGQDLKITSLNLSSSGICPYNCPDCYAKTMQHFCTSLGHKPMVFDMIRQNDKQAGKTKHIQRNT